ELRRRALQRLLHRLHDAGQRLLQRVEDFVGVHREVARHARGQVSPDDVDLLHFVARERRADLDLDALGGGFADEHVVLTADVRDDRLVELVAADAHRLGVDDAAERDDRDFGRTAADVEDHRAARLGDRDAGAHRGGDRLFDHVDLARAGVLDRLADGASLDLGRAVGDADDHAGHRLQHAALLHLADEVLQHLLGDGEVGDDAVTQRADAGDVVRRAAEHALGVEPHRFDFLGAADVVADGDHRRLVEHDAFITNEDQGVGGAEVNGQVVDEQTTDRIEHSWAAEERAVSGGARKTRKCSNATSFGQGFLVVFLPPLRARRPPPDEPDPRTDQAGRPSGATGAQARPDRALRAPALEHPRDGQPAVVGRDGSGAADGAPARHDLFSASCRDHRSGRRSWPRALPGARAGSGERPLPRSEGHRVTMHKLSIRALAEGLRTKKFSSRELTQHFLKRIESHDQLLNSFVTVTADQALKAADAADARIGKGQAGPLTGVPIAQKDIFCTAGVKTSCGSKMLDKFVAPYDATIVKKLHAEAGAVMLGKANMDEFAMGSSNETSYYGPVKNPWDVTRVPGGSSGGSVASVAAGLAVAATATDTGGSIRQPAALTNLTGIKPTYGRVSRYGMIAFASSLDQAGVVAHTAEDAAAVLQAMAGFDPLDSTSVDKPVDDYVGGLDKSIKGLRIGLPKEYFAEGLAPGARERVNAAIKKFEELGATVSEIS